MFDDKKSNIFYFKLCFKNFFLKLFYKYKFLQNVKLIKETNKIMNYKNEETNSNEEMLELPADLVEKIVCKQLLNPNNADNSFFIQQYFKANWFKNESLVLIYSLLLNYYKKYNNYPTKEIIYKILENDKFKDKYDKLLNSINELYNIEESKYDDIFLRDTLIKFTKARAMYFAILDNVDEIEKRGDIGNCLTRFENIVNIGISNDLGIEYFENLNNHIHELTNVENRTPFNYKDWDKYTYGGIPVGEACLFILMAQPGLGKSQVMMNIGYQWILQNKNVLMISLEMSEQMYSRRMSALFSDINVNKLKDHTEILKKRVSTTKLSCPKARLYIKQFSPIEFNSIKLKHLLKKLKETKDFIPDLIIVDYLNIMATNSPSYNMKSYERVGTISKELRSVSIETHLPILSATQSNRSGAGGGYAGEDISMNNTSDSAGINMDADAIFALYQLEGERELGRINVKILKNRLGGYVDTIFPMTVNYETLKIGDWNQETDDDTASSLLNEEIKNNKISKKEKEEINELFEEL